MRHARPDYNRIQDPAVQDPSLLAEGCQPIGEDEPVFILRAKDVLAPDLLDEWARRLRGVNGDERTAERVERWAHVMRAWQDRNGAKVPDTPEGMPGENSEG